MASESGIVKVKVDLTESDLVELLSVFAKKAFDASTTEPGSLDAVILYNCDYLMSLDYNVFNIDNSGGVLCARYPPSIFVPESELDNVSTAGDSSANTACNSNGTNGYECANGCDGNAKNRKPNRHSNGTTARSITPTNENEHSNGNGIGNGNACDNYTGNSSDSDSTIQSFVTVTRPQRPPKQRTIYEEMYDANRIRDLITRARYARCRQRFVAPVIYFRGQYICRSATVSVVHETYSRYAYDYITSGSGNETQQRTNEEENPDSSEDSLLGSLNDTPSPFSYNEMIRNDIALLNTLNIKTIVDLMVEQRKVKFFITVSSSEKADPEHNYKNFNLLALPYPGCEFFKKFREHNYMATNLHYNWQKPFNNANISIPKIGPAMDLDINWEEYRKWDLVEITQNYLKAMLKYVQEENSGLLVHCISGWDRTPLFISLLRLSLWADGLIHQSLNYLQITYFTLAYDWYLFGHQLPDREKRGEDIMVFCFHMLKFLTSEEFSLGEHRKRTKTTSSSGSCGLAPKHEDEAALREELYLAACDHDSNDSYSNISNCDLQITDTLTAMTISNASTQATTSNNTITNRSPNSKRTRTSPVPVPGGNSTRQRQESVSSNSSWHLVTDTGSIDSVVAGSYMRNHVAQRSECGSVNSNSSNQSSRRSNGSTCRYSGSDTLDSSPSAHNSSGASNNSGNSFNSAVSNHSAGPSHMLPTTTEGIATASNGEQAKSSSPKPGGSRMPITNRERRLNSVRAIFVRAYGKGVGLKLREGTGISIATFIGTLF